jgi:muramoyltetrapeptide carboxypeptidase
MFSRRTFIKSSLSAAALLPLSVHSRPQIQAAKSSRPLIKPAALCKGDTIGLITPASSLFEGHRTLIEAQEKLANLGFASKPGANIFEQHGYLAGTIAQRVADIHAMLVDEEVKALMTIRGGYGSAQLLPYLDYNLIQKYPKIIIGYSDVTALIIGVHQMTGLVTFHGPVAVSTFTGYAQKYFIKTLMEKTPAGLIDDAPYQANLQTSNRIWAYRAGQAEGRLIGGNLTLLQATLGTPYEFDSRGAILFIEEVSEEPYDLDRMLTHLKLAGKFDHCRGVFFDNLSEVRPADYKPGFERSLSVEEIIHDIFKDFSFPVGVGFSIGHIKDKPTLPLGVLARIDAGKGQLTLLEAAVS